MFSVLLLKGEFLFHLKLISQLINEPIVQKLYLLLPISSFAFIDHQILGSSDFPFVSIK